ncbi:hypothetical protein [Rubellimicrobium roseum]|uniref:Uncharacterized protein n=1 Tax=Rubellimicrobium roseum TaxID=687525 RepID=A0A5C4ND33_9RHOB|nr:hypothetical protein [Rubellimicrobium roseum]TNC69839.1 hypothetical protein FHG71_13555 [Rubellimicrobium roseum]
MAGAQPDAALSDLGMGLPSAAGTPFAPTERAIPYRRLDGIAATLPMVVPTAEGPPTAQGRPSLIPDGSLPLPKPLNPLARWLLIGGSLVLLSLLLWLVLALRRRHQARAEIRKRLRRSRIRQDRRSRSTLPLRRTFPNAEPMPGTADLREAA